MGYEYEADNRLQSVTTKYMNNTNPISFGYDSTSRLTGISYPNGVNSMFGLDGEGRVASIEHGSFVDRTIQRNVLGFEETELIDAEKFGIALASIGGGFFFQGLEFLGRFPRVGTPQIEVLFRGPKSLKFLVRYLFMLVGGLTWAAPIGKLPRYFI